MHAFTDDEPPMTFRAERSAVSGSRLPEVRGRGRPVRERISGRWPAVSASAVRSPDQLRADRRCRSRSVAKEDALPLVPPPTMMTSKRTGRRIGRGRYPGLSGRRWTISRRGTRDMVFARAFEEPSRRLPRTRLLGWPAIAARRHTSSSRRRPARGRRSPRSCSAIDRLNDGTRRRACASSTSRR